MPKPRSGFRAFVEAHDQLFTMVGALIVFLGFFAKEGLRENGKDLATSIKTAQVLSTFEGTLSDISHSLERSSSAWQEVGRVDKNSVSVLAFEKLSSAEQEVRDLLSTNDDLVNRATIASQLLLMHSLPTQQTLARSGQLFGKS